MPCKTRYFRLTTCSLAVAIALTFAYTEKEAHAENGDRMIPITVSAIGTGRYAGRFYEVGAFSGVGGPFSNVKGLVNPIGFSGVRVLENQGYVSKFSLGMLVALAAGMAGDKQLTGSKTERRGDYIVRTDYYRQRTPEEMAAIAAAPGAVMDGEYIMELNVYSSGFLGSTKDRPQASGFEFYLGDRITSSSSQPVSFQWAFAYSKLTVSDALFKAGQGPNATTGTPGATAEHIEKLTYTNLGLMLEFQAPIIGSYLEGFARWDLNVLGKNNGQQDLHGHPFRAGLVVNASDRIFGRAYGSVVGFSTNVGWVLEAGVRL